MRFVRLGLQRRTYLEVTRSTCRTPGATFALIERPGHHGIGGCGLAWSGEFFILESLMSLSKRDTFVRDVK